MQLASRWVCRYPLFGSGLLRTNSAFGTNLGNDEAARQRKKRLRRACDQFLINVAKNPGLRSRRYERWVLA